uniref:Uncharacterized protein n=1 Tax=Anser brachyrhynchus TaxID=132585 RepID=A0A8B9CTE5_9AVES
MHIIRKESKCRDLQQRQAKHSKLHACGQHLQAADLSLTSLESREQLINDRIGYKPQPKAGGRAAHFGTFEF